MRLAGDPPDVHDHAARRPYRLARFPSCRRSDRGRHGRRRKRRSNSINRIDRRSELGSYLSCEGDICAQVVWQLICAVVQVSWHDEPIEPFAIAGVDVVCAAIERRSRLERRTSSGTAPPVELHAIMQLVTAEVTFEVCGETGVKDCACARAAPQRQNGRRQRRRNSHNDCPAPHHRLPPACRAATAAHGS